MPEVNVLREIEILIRSQYGLVIIDTNEPERAEKYIKELKNHLDTQLFIWTPAKGLYESKKQNSFYKSKNAHKVLEHIDKS